MSGFDLREVAECAAVRAEATLAWDGPVGVYVPDRPDPGVVSGHPRLLPGRHRRLRLGLRKSGQAH